MHRRSRWFTAVICVLVSIGPHTKAGADVIVLANRTGFPLQFQFSPLAGQVQQVQLAAGEAVPMFVDGRAQITFSSREGARHYQLDANCAYFFGRGIGGRVDLQKIGLGETEAVTGGRTLPGSAARAPTAVVPVKILVDEEEPGRQVYWERRLRRRIEAASAILEKHSRVRLQVTAIGTWNSDNGTNDFIASLGEFEREVQPSPARVAIGFTSQWQMVRGRTHMAGTRGPLHSHILVREGSPEISEPEKLEFLVHELGHYLGASHSPERTSVMRPVLGDNLAGRSDYQIRFDPVNTLVIAMVGEEIRRRNVDRITDLTPDTRNRLRQIYSELSRSLPRDPASPRYVQLMGMASSSNPIAQPARRILQELTRAAIANRGLPMVADSQNKTGATQRTEDALCDYYVRRAARAAATLPADIGPRAFLVALGIGLDDSDVLATIPGAGGLYRQVEPPDARVLRLSVLGKPTMRGRRDWAQHFFVSGYLTATVGEAAANSAGIAKEMLDAQGSSGFSFADVAADRAGVRFAEGVLSGRLPLNLLAQGFAVAGFLPELDDLPENLSAAELSEQYGSATDPRFQQQLKEIDERVQQLPAYRISLGGTRRP